MGAETGITYQQEDFRDIYDEAMPLFVEHWREISHYPDIELAPDRAIYEKAAEMGMIKVFTAREGTDLVGYAFYFVRPNLHYRNSIQAQQDIIFVKMEKRRGSIGVRLISFADDRLREMGVQVVMQHVKVAHPALGNLLEKRLGYEHVEQIYTRRLDRC
jgi:hypothetical protein